MDAIRGVEMCGGEIREGEITFSYNGEALQVVRWGNLKNTPVVLLHGFMQSAHSWDAVARSLAQDYCVYALSFMGHGASSKSLNPARYAYDDMAASVDVLLREVVLPKYATHGAWSEDCVMCEGEAPSARGTCLTEEGVVGAHIIGYSMGGRIALRLLQTSADCVASLILEACNLGCETLEDQRQASIRNAGWVEHLREKGMTSFVAYWESLPMFATQRAGGFDARLRAGRLANEAEPMALCLEGAGKQAMPLAPETRQYIAEAAIPLAYFYGDQDGKSEQVAQQLQPLGVAISSFPAGHNVHLEAPMLYLEEVRNFLSRVDASRQHGKE